VLIRLVLSFLLLSFALASPVRAASVNIDVALTGGTSWDLLLTTVGGQSVSGLSLVVSDSLESFTLNPAFAGPPTSCALGASGCELTPIGTMPGFNLLVLSFSPNFVGSGPSVLIGTFASSVNSASLVQVLPADSLVGGTVFDGVGAPISDFAIHVVPEPAAAALVSLTCLLAARLRST